MEGAWCGKGKIAGSPLNTTFCNSKSCDTHWMIFPLTGASGGPPVITVPSSDEAAAATYPISANVVASVWSGSVPV